MKLDDISTSCDNGFIYDWKWASSEREVAIVDISWGGSPLHSVRVETDCDEEKSPSDGLFSLAKREHAKLEAVAMQKYNEAKAV